jgi:hypothetical protein
VSRVARLLVLALAVGTAAAGCGSSRGMSDTAGQQLGALVATVRTAAAAHDAARADAALARLGHAVHNYERSGDISTARASEILGAAARVKTRLASITTTTTTTTTTPPPPPHEDHHDQNKHHGKDKGGNGNEG